LVAAAVVSAEVSAAVLCAAAVSTAVAFGAVAPSQAAPTREAQVGAAMEKLKDDPPGLRVFLTAMPKGGDLHNHLDGSVWAEDYLAWADADGDCIDALTHVISLAPCSSGQIEARGLIDRDNKFYQASIDALSMRNFFPGTGTGETNGHDHAFAAFPRFSALVPGHLAEEMAVVRRQAAADHVIYLETITDPAVAFAPALLGGLAHFDPQEFDTDLGQLAAQLPALVAASRNDFDRAERKASLLLRCASTDPDAACAVRTRYLYYVVRTFQPAQVFAQIALGFALVAADPRFVGINLVAPEDDPVALRDFRLQMRMFQYFGAKYPGIKLSLHGGELALGIVPPAALGFHLRETVEIAGASRIGHGYEIPYEVDAQSLLTEMAAKRVAVEINLTSNEVTPGIKGADHPLKMYRKAGVPVVLSADDEGLIRIDLTHEYVRAVLEQGLDYADLKAISRNGIKYGFLPAPEKAAAEASLDTAFESFERRVLSHKLPE
jgi:adenosine deaminase